MKVMLGWIVSYLGVCLLLYLFYKMGVLSHLLAVIGVISVIALSGFFYWMAPKANTPNIAASDIRGRLLNADGEPEPDVRVTRSWHYDEKISGEQTTQTDNGGNFHFPAARAPRPLLWFYGLSTRTFEVRVTADAPDDGEVRLMHYVKMGLEENGERVGDMPIHVECVLDKDAESEEGFPFGACRLVADANTNA